MHDQPDAVELIEAVRDFIRDDVSPELKGRKLFLARVAANALDIVARQVALGPAQTERELKSLRKLLTTDEGSLESLNRELCARIRDKSLSLDNPTLIEHLRSTTLDKLAVDQPKYSSYQAAMKEK